MFDPYIIRDDVPLHVRRNQLAGATLANHSKVLSPFAKHDAVGDYFTLHIQPETIGCLPCFVGAQFVGKLALQKFRRILF